MKSLRDMTSSLEEGVILSPGNPVRSMTSNSSTQVRSLRIDSSKHWVLAVFCATFSKTKESSLYLRGIYKQSKVMFTICKNAFSFRGSKSENSGHVCTQMGTSGIPMELRRGTCLKAVPCPTDHMGTSNLSDGSGRRSAGSSTSSWMTRWMTASGITVLGMCFLTKRHSPRRESYPQGKYPTCGLFLSIGKLCLLQNN